MFSPDNVDALESMTPIPVTRGLTIKDAFNTSGDLEHGPQDQVHVFIVCSQYGMTSPFAHPWLNKNAETFVDLHLNPNKRYFHRVWFRKGCGFALRNNRLEIEFDSDKDKSSRVVSSLPSIYEELR